LELSDSDQQDTDTHELEILPLSEIESVESVSEPLSVYGHRLSFLQSRTSKQLKEICINLGLHTSKKISKKEFVECILKGNDKTFLFHKRKVRLPTSKVTKRLIAAGVIDYEVTDLENYTLLK